MKIKTILSTLLLLASLKAVQSQTVLVDWTFDNASNTPPIINPAPFAGVNVSTALAQTVGMTNTYTTAPSIGQPDVIKNPAANSDSTPSLGDAWRVRGNGASPNNGNGWSQAAPVGSQGAQFAVSTVGYYDIQLTFDLTATVAGEGLVQVTYTTDGINWSNAVLSSTAYPSRVLNNSTTSFGNVTNGLVVGSYFNLTTNGAGAYQQLWYTNITANLRGIPAANNNPNFAIRIVNAAMGTNCVAATNAPLNNTSGNWSMDNVQITGIPPIAQWTFDNLVTATNLNPAPNINNTVNGVSVASLAMNVYSTPGVGNNTPDVVQGAGTDSGNDGITNVTLTWRVRATGAGNGWSSAAPIGTQGAQFNVDTTGYTNVAVSFDWYLTSQGEANLQFEYTVDGVNWSNAPIAIPAAQVSGNYIQFVDNTSDSDSLSVQGYYVNCEVTSLKQEWFTNLTVVITNPAAANNPLFGIQFVNASTGASCVAAAGTGLNNSSGNWRFDNVTVAGNSIPGAITLLTPPVISAAANATVDNPFTNTFTDNAAWRANITNITVNGSFLSPSAYAVSAGQIVYTPSASTLLQKSGTKSIVVLATNYLSDPVTQIVLPGVATSLAITNQPVGPTGNGGTLVAQPAVAVEDQYANVVTNASGSATASVGAGSWTFGAYSGTSILLTNGGGTFTNLSVTSAAAVSGAVITLTVNTGGSPIVTNCTSFNIPAPSGSFHTGDLAVEQEDRVTKNSTFSILDISSTTPNQSAPVNVYPVPATSTNGLRQSSSGSTGRLADSDDGTLVCFSAAQSQDSSVADATTVDPRGAGTFNYQGQYVLQATYIGLGDATADQARSVCTFDDTNWFMGDKGGVYTNGDTGGNAYIVYSQGNPANVRSIKSYGGTVYVMQQEGGTDPTSSVLDFLPMPNGAPASSIPGTPTPGSQSLFPLEGFPVDGNVLDFYLLKSGNNGNVYDCCYYIDGTNTTSGAIFKYYYSGNVDGISGQQIWNSTGASWPTPNGGDGLCVRTNASGGVDLYYTTGSGGTAGNSIVMLHDSSAWNAPISMTATNVLYTVSASSTLKGIAFAPINPNAVVPVTPILINPGTVHYSSTGAGNGSFTLNFSNTSGASSHFNILATTNITLPINQWVSLGNPTEVTSGNYSFTDTGATNAGEYYIIQFNP